MLLAGAGTGVGFEAVYLYLLLADLAVAVDLVLDLVQAGLDVVVAGLESLHDSDVVLVAFDSIGDSVLVGLRDISVCRWDSFPVRKVVWVAAADALQLFFYKSFLLL